MFAIVAEAVIASGKRAAYEAVLAEYLALRAKQPGEIGAIQVAASEERDLLLALWDNAALSRSAHAAVLTPASDRLLRPLLAAPLRVLGAGEVTHDSLTPAAPLTGRSVVGFVNEAVIAADQRADYDAMNRELAALRSRQPGFCGSVEFDAGEGQIIWLAVWESREAVQAAATALRPLIDRLHIPVLSRGSLGSGPVVRDTISGQGARPSRHQP